MTLTTSLVPSMSLTHSASRSGRSPGPPMPGPPTPGSGSTSSGSPAGALARHTARSPATTDHGSGHGVNPLPRRNVVGVRNRSDHDALPDGRPSSSHDTPATCRAPVTNAPS
ncbi:hypothetical protein O7543_07075 [Solwaraspora sp. WMMA2080]|uniref:hypothetical protein n=1 Tax=unclassified Solwaraspora TaxID=2627926 RepID=UPI00248CD241|nr:MULTISPECIES: hypothetical protein [unclassified Solwaraspora]WBB99236.1 hypothetical protein O7553_10295 [Solwaraspora sp. WMMA2059]WBC22212.1 hypothetical protein O7543_07075 [Solwaraspora sp. WMMA2080]WJK35745.1 hypothetical protein O7610_05060 [Solwaraspora sp. WMMA2065]